MSRIDLKKAKRWRAWQIALCIIAIVVAAGAIAMFLVNYQEYVDQHISSGNGENSLEDALGALAFAILLVIPFAVQIIVSGLLIVCLIVAMSSMASRGYARKRDVVGMIVCKYIFLVPSILIFVLFFTRYSIPMFIMHALVTGTLIFDYIYPVDDCVDAFKEAKTVKAKVQENSNDLPENTQSDEQNPTDMPE